MLQYVAIISFAVGMGGMLEKLGVLEHILNAVVKRINSDGSMILVTLIVWLYHKFDQLFPANVSCTDRPLNGTSI